LGFLRRRALALQKRALKSGLSSKGRLKITIIVMSLVRRTLSKTFFC
jgi:hypothetical protein